MAGPADDDFDDVDEEFEDDDDFEEEEDDEELASTDVLKTANIGDVSVEINVEQLVSDIETVQSGEGDSAAARRRLEALLEEKRLLKAIRALDEFDFDD